MRDLVANCNIFTCTMIQYQYDSGAPLAQYAILSCLRPPTIPPSSCFVYKIRNENWLSQWVRATEYRRLLNKRFHCIVGIGDRKSANSDNFSIWIVRYSITRIQYESVSSRPLYAFSSCIILQPLHLFFSIYFSLRNKKTTNNLNQTDQSTETKLNGNKLIRNYYFC